MLNELSFIGTHGKLFLATMAAAGAVLAEAVTNAADNPMMDYTSQGALVAALAFVVRYLMQALKEHKEEMKTTRDRHEEVIRRMHAEHTEIAAKREDLMRGTLERHSLTMQELVKQGGEQLSYFREVTQAALKSQLEKQQQQ